MNKTKLISPTRGENYTVMDALKKGFYRSNLLSDEIEVFEVDRSCVYGDADYLIKIKNFRCSDSVWTESISFCFQELYLKAHVKGGTNAFQFDLDTCFHTWESDREKTKEKRSKYERCFETETLAGEHGVGFCGLYLKVGEEAESIAEEALCEEEIKTIKRLAKEHILSKLFISRFHDRSI
ncbi:hypothetical protein [Campylobacter sp. RM16191]|uniref:hypothetical protein n=1 Tax=Campylobacter sp. RM16191 TaxID=1705728 RepID=UPI001474CEDC|nr:hypothetical protein [Campylobacter sp. RM16191]